MLRDVFLASIFVAYVEPKLYFLLSRGKILQCSPYFHHHGGSSGRAVPPYIYPSCVSPTWDRGLNAAASVASSLGVTVAPLGSLLRSTRPPLLTSNITMSFSEFWIHTQDNGSVPSHGPPHAPHLPPPGPSVALPHAPVVPPQVPVVILAPLALPPVPVVPPLVPVRAKLLKLDPIKDAKGFIDSLEQIQFYHQMPEFSTGHSDDSLTTDAINLEASRAWEGQLRMAVKDGNLRFLFKNKGVLFHGRGFKMLATLMKHCRPDFVSNAFTSLLSIFKDVQGKSESILKYCSRFDGLTMELARCKVIILSILSVMLFLRALHSWYATIFEQYWSRFKPIKTATLDSIVSDVTFHDGFTVVDSKKKPPGSWLPAAALANTNSNQKANTNTDQKGNVWQTPFEWLAQYGMKGIKGRWTRAMAGTGICPICHREELPRHVPTQCLLLAQLGLKLVTCPPVANPPPPAPSPALAPTLSGRAAAADGSSKSSSSESGSAPSGLMAALAPVDPPLPDFESDDEYHWDGDEYGAEYSSIKVNRSVAPYSPSCSHITLVASASLLDMSPSPSPASQPRLSPKLIHLLGKLSLMPVDYPHPHGPFAVADTGATDHMIPDKSCFISYKLVSGLSVCMGNNSFVPVLGHGTAIFSLNGKRILVRNVLHIPRLAVPLYSLHTHINQHGCGFIGTGESGFLVYFPLFVLLVDMAIDCHLSFAPLGHSAPLNTLHYVQPRCPPAPYPSTITPAVSQATPSPLLPVVVEDDADDYLAATPSSSPALIRSTMILSTWVHSPLNSRTSLMQSVVSPLLCLHPLTLQHHLPCNQLPRMSMCWTPLNWLRVMRL